MNEDNWPRGRLERAAMWGLAGFAVLALVGVLGMLFLIYEALEPFAQHMRYAE